MAPWPYMALQPKLAPPDDNEMSANLAHKSSCFSATVFLCPSNGRRNPQFFAKNRWGALYPYSPLPPNVGRISLSEPGSGLRPGSLAGSALAPRSIPTLSEIEPAIHRENNKVVGKRGSRRRHTPTIPDCTGTLMASRVDLLHAEVARRFFARWRLYETRPRHEGVASRRKLVRRVKRLHGDRCLPTFFSGTRESRERESRANGPHWKTVMGTNRRTAHFGADDVWLRHQAAGHRADGRRLVADFAQEIQS